jgi:hypothetical protein
MIDRSRARRLAAWFDAQSHEQHMEAAQRIGVLAHAEALRQMGWSKFVADLIASRRAGCSARSVQRWRRDIYGIRPGDQLALIHLCPRRKPRRRKPRTARACS